MPPGGDPRTDVLIVATWFPSVDDPGAGRFVADQAEALETAGDVRPAVVSFDPVRLTGGARARTLQAAAILDAGRAAVGRAEPLFVRPAWGVEPGLPVARVSIPEGLTASTGSAHAAAHREVALRAVGDRLVAAGRGGRDRRAGVVHAHTGYPDGAAAVALADVLGWPLIVTEHASFVDRLIRDPALRDRYAAMLRRADRLFAVSEGLAAELRASFPDHAATMDVLPNAVAVARFAAAPIAERRADELLFVGYRKASKGIETLLRGVAAAHARRPTISLRLVGRASSEQEDAGWRALATELGIGDAVTFDGSTDRAGVADAMRRASVFVHASPRETFGVVAVEALASGLPVVATDSGGVTEILGDDPDRLGAIVPIDDPEAFGAAVLRTLEGRASFDPAALRAAVERRFGAEVVAERLHLAYRGALARWPPTPEATTAPPAGRTRAATAIDAVVGAAGPTAARETAVIALDRETAARRVAVLPAALRAELTLVTGVEPASVELPPVGRLIEIAVEPGWKPIVRTGVARRAGWLGRLVRLATDPVGTLHRRTGREVDPAAWLEPAGAAIARLVAEDRARSIELIAVDGHDVLAVEPVARTSPELRSDGGLRRLADRSLAGPDPDDG